MARCRQLQRCLHLDALKAYRGVTTRRLEALARLFDVSTRTIRRDIAALCAARSEMSPLREGDIAGSESMMRKKAS
jgi:predicted DNA-binding transcriptional regulator YafY